MSEPVSVTRDGAVTIVTINRPERRNAINQYTAELLREAWLSFDADDSARVGVLTGGDSVFCAGADLKEIESLDAESEDGPLGFTRLWLSKPVIAAIAGYAVAGGMEVACWCDLRIADETASFGFLERRWGVPLVDGGTQRLPRIVGLGRALDLILTGRPMDVHEAHAIGFVNQVVPKGQHIARAVEWAKHIAAFPPICLTNDRKAVYMGLGKSLEEGLRLEASLGLETMHSGEPYEGAQRFVDGAGRGGAFGDA